MKKISLHEASIEMISEVTQRVLGPKKPFAVDIDQCPGCTNFSYSLYLPDLTAKTQQDLHNALNKRFAFPIRRGSYNTANVGRIEL